MPTMLPAANVGDLLKIGGSKRRNVDVKPRFASGDKVRAANINPVKYTRLPRYVRGKIGIVQMNHGVFVFPDTNAEGKEEKPQNVYSVMFTARELWGPDASEGR